MMDVVILCQVHCSTSPSRLLIQKWVPLLVVCKCCAFINWHVWFCLWNDINKADSHGNAFQHGKSITIQFHHSIYDHSPDCVIFWRYITRHNNLPAIINVCWKWFWKKQRSLPKTLKVVKQQHTCPPLCWVSLWAHLKKPCVGTHWMHAYHSIIHVK